MFTNTNHRVLVTDLYNGYQSVAIAHDIEFAGQKVGVGFDRETECTSGNMREVKAIYTEQISRMN